MNRLPASRRHHAAAGTVAALLAFAAGGAWAGRQAPALFVNGKQAAKAPLVQDGETYIPLSALREAGAEVTVAATRVSVQFTPVRGQNQLDLFEGVAGEFVNNGIWRIKAGQPRAIKNPFGNGPGFEVDVEIRNASARAQSLHGSGLHRMQLVTTRGAVLEAAAGSFKTRYQSVPPGGAVSETLRFGDPRNLLSEAGDGDKLMAAFRPNGGKPALKGFRISLRPAAAEGAGGGG